MRVILTETCHFLSHNLNLSHHRHGTVDAVNHAAVAQTRISRNHFNWLEAAGTLSERRKGEYCYSRYAIFCKSNILTLKIYQQHPGSIAIHTTINRVSKEENNKMNDSKTNK
jgi:hypothetical protein